MLKHCIAKIWRRNFDGLSIHRNWIDRFGCLACGTNTILGQLGARDKIVGADGSRSFPSGVKVFCSHIFQLQFCFRLGCSHCLFLRTHHGDAIAHQRAQRSISLHKLFRQIRGWCMPISTGEHIFINRWRMYLTACLSTLELGESLLAAMCESMCSDRYFNWGKMHARTAWFPIFPRPMTAPNTVVSGFFNSALL